MRKVIECPVCGDVYTRQRPPYAIRGYEPSDPALPAYRGYPLRGDGLVIPFTGECGHAWDLILGSHKGETELWVVRRPDLLPEDEVVCCGVER